MNRAWVPGGLLLGAALLAAPVLHAQEPQSPRPTSQAAPLKKVTIGYIDLENDPRHEAVKLSERLVLRARENPFPGARLGVEDSAPLRRTLGAEFTLERMTAKTVEEMPAAVTRGVESGINFFLVDAPAEAWKALAASAKGKDVLLFNISAPQDALRRDLCSRETVHVYPSRAQLMDGLVQFLVHKKWRDYLVLEGPLSEDAEISAAFQRSAKKFGARIVAAQKFVPGTDPRQREKNNPALLSAINRDWDVTFLADSAFDFAREVSYRTIRPRPVVGAIDLEPQAWHWTWEHNGGIQVNTRFMRLTGGRKMDSGDWAAWIAVKMIVQSALRTRSTEFGKQRDFIFGPGSFDGDKVVAMTVRPWDHQLRQAVLLASPWSVAGAAPVEGFMHRTDTLDSLGDDEPETPCKMNK